MRHLKHYFALLPFRCRSQRIDTPLSWYNIHIIIIIIISIYVTQRTAVVILFRNIHNLLNKLWHTVSSIFVEERNSLKALPWVYFTLYSFYSYIVIYVYTEWYISYFIIL